MSAEQRRAYERDAQRMLAAVRQWQCENDAARLVLYMPPAEVFVASPLDGPIVELVARDEFARSFVAWIDQRTNYQGTLEMLARVPPRSSDSRSAFQARVTCSLSALSCGSRRGRTERARAYDRTEVFRMRAFFLVLLVLVLGCSAEADGYIVTEFQTDRFDAAPLDSFTYDVPAGAVSWRLAGNPNRSASPFVETMWFSLAADDRNLDFFRGDELGADRLREVPVGNADVLHVDNAGGAYVAGAVVWTLERVR